MPSPLLHRRSPPPHRIAAPEHRKLHTGDTHSKSGGRLSAAAAAAATAATAAIHTGRRRRRAPHNLPKPVSFYAFYEYCPAPLAGTSLGAMAE
ncbi:hypothetical protein CGMCC3_g6070 [Colletotrichum fructicola]|nr:uncharacterized protein CGMCC3_g6070 [Colletotrichum fructicola]KAE9578195.1 hypothetical protein CGMCC3_g6070 [Colletotrichum fructicola]